MNGKTAGNLILMTTICIVIFWIFMGIKAARAQSPSLQDVYGWGAGEPYSPRMNVYRWGWGWAPPPLAYAPPAPLGWIWGHYAPCGDPQCGVLVVQVVDGLNVRATPGGIVTGALANGVPVVPLDKAGPWVLVAPACPLAPTFTWSVTAGVPLSVCL